MKAWAKDVRSRARERGHRGRDRDARPAALRHGQRRPRRGRPRCLRPRARGGAGVGRQGRRPAGDGAGPDRLDRTGSHAAMETLRERLAGIAGDTFGPLQAPPGTPALRRHAGFEHGPGHRHGVREGARLHDERRRGGRGHRGRPPAPGPVAHAVRDRRRHPRRRAQLPGRARRLPRRWPGRTRRASSSASPASSSRASPRA